MNVRRSFVVLVVLVLVSPVWAQEKAQEKAKGEAAEIGKPAPNFTLTDTEGKKHSLSQYAGNVVVLEWTNHECPVVQRCHNEKLMSKTLANFKGKPVVWLAVNSSSFCKERLVALRNWAKEQGVQYPVLLDAPGTVGKLFGAKTTPHMFVIDQKGVLAYSGAIDNARETDVKKVRNYVEEAVSALLAGSKVATTRTKPYGCSVKYKS